MKTFKQLTESLNSGDNHLSNEEIAKFKKSMNSGKNTSGLYDNYKKHPEGHVTYTFNGYMGGALRKKNGVIHHAQDIDEDNVDWEDKQSGVTSHPNIENAINFNKKNLDPDFHDHASKTEKDAFYKAHDYKRKVHEDLNEISSKLHYRYIDKATKYLDKNSDKYLKHDAAIDKLKSTKARSDEKANAKKDFHNDEMNKLDILGRKRQKSLEKALKKDTRSKPNPYR